MDIRSTLRVGHRLFLAGGAWGRAARSLGPRCADGCNPVVWLSENGRLHPVLLVPAQGSIDGEHLSRMPWGILLLNRAEGTAAWVSRTGTVWRRLSLPRSVAEAPRQVVRRPPRPGAGGDSQPGGA
ncbi:MAG TPA: hypothetical protein VHB69_13020, partial [Mycobacteriales bacterium]|nr:hypothetical protein [Mycobacteriales bacterium]